MLESVCVIASKIMVWCICAGEGTTDAEPRSADEAEPLSAAENGLGPVKSPIEPKLYRILSSVPEVATLCNVTKGLPFTACMHSLVEYH